MFAWNARLKDGSLLGSIAFVSGPILDGPGGPVEPKSYGVFIASAEQGRAEVDTLKARGADFVKVYDALSRESYFAIAAESKKIGLPFVGHVPNEVTMLEAVHAGQRSIEHGIEHRGESTAEEDLIARRKSDDYFAKAMRKKKSLLPEAVYKEADAGSRRSYHLRQSLLRDLGDHRLRFTRFVEICHEQEDAGKSLFARIEELVHQICTGFHPEGNTHMPVESERY